VPAPESGEEVPAPAPESGDPPAEEAPAESAPTNAAEVPAEPAPEKEEAAQEESAPEPVIPAAPGAEKAAQMTPRVDPFAAGAELALPDIDSDAPAEDGTASKVTFVPEHGSVYVTAAVEALVAALLHDAVVSLPPPAPGTPAHEEGGVYIPGGEDDDTIPPEEEIPIQAPAQRIVGEGTLEGLMTKRDGEWKTLAERVAKGLGFENMGQYFAHLAGASS